MPLNLILDQRLSEDRWVHLADDAPLPVGGDITVTLARWQKESSELRAFSGHVGVRVPSTADIEETAPALFNCPLVILEFPSFPDGRAFTQARLLRERFGYKGELRATGDVRRDQVFYMQRCGFNAFAPAPHVDIGEVFKALTEITLTYQNAADQRPTISQRRSAA